MELALQRYGSYEKFEQATGGDLLTKSRVWHDIKKYMEKEGCVGEVSGREAEAPLQYVSCSELVRRYCRRAGRGKRKSKSSQREVSLKFACAAP